MAIDPEKIIIGLLSTVLAIVVKALWAWLKDLDIRFSFSFRTRRRQ